jgi:hypothetical protein
VELPGPPGGGCSSASASTGWPAGCTARRAPGRTEGRRRGERRGSTPPLQPGSCPASPPGLGLARSALPAEGALWPSGGCPLRMRMPCCRPCCRPTPARYGCPAGTGRTARRAPGRTEGLCGRQEAGRLGVRRLGRGRGGGGGGRGRLEGGARRTENWMGRGDGMAKLDGMGRWEGPDGKALMGSHLVSVVGLMCTTFDNAQRRVSTLPSHGWVGRGSRGRCARSIVHRGHRSWPKISGVPMQAQHRRKGAFPTLQPTFKLPNRTAINSHGGSQRPGSCPRTNYATDRCASPQLGGTGDSEQKGGNGVGGLVSGGAWMLAGWPHAVEARRGAELGRQQGALQRPL